MASSLGHDEQLDSSLHPIAILLEELKNDNLQLRLNATRRIKTIADALGPERTRAELLPFITDNIYFEDDVSLALAEELGSFVDHVGGPAHAPVLLQLLETLSAAEESTIREKAVESICKLSASVSSVSESDGYALQVDHVFPLLQRLVMGDWFTSRISSCTLAPHVYEHLPPTRPELRTEALAIYKRLAHDDGPMVRRAASSNLGAMTQAVFQSAPHLISTELFDVFSKLVKDEQDSVRLLVVENAATFANLLCRAEAIQPTHPNDVDVNNRSGPNSQASNDTVMDGREDSEAHDESSRPISNPAQSDTSVPMGDVSDQPQSNGTSHSTDMTGSRNHSANANTPAKNGNTAMSTYDTSSQPAPTGNGTSAIEGLSDTVSRVIEMVTGFVLDKSWRVRCMIANQIPALCDALGPKATRFSLLRAYVIVLQDSEPEVRTAAGLRFSDVVSKLVNLPSEPGVDSGFECAMRDILPIVDELVADIAQHVRSALASNIMELAPLLGSEKTVEHLIDPVLSLLKDDSAEVRLNVITGLEKVSFIMSIERLSEELLPAIVELAEDKNWRVRVAIIERLALLATQMGKQLFEKNGKLGALCISWLSDCVYSIREAAICNLKKLTEIFGVDWAKVHVVPQILEMYEKSNNYLLRMTALRAIGVLSQVVGVETVENLFLPIVTDRAPRDPVPNVRFCAAKMLNSVIPYVRHDVRESKIRPCLMLLVGDNETDADVNYFAEQALIKLASSPCPS